MNDQTVNTYKIKYDIPNNLEIFLSFISFQKIKDIPKTTKEKKLGKANKDTLENRYIIRSYNINRKTSIFKICSSW